MQSFMLSDRSKLSGLLEGLGVALKGRSRSSRILEALGLLLFPMLFVCLSLFSFEYIKVLDFLVFFPIKKSMQELLDSFEKSDFLTLFNVEQISLDTSKGICASVDAGLLLSRVGKAKVSRDPKGESCSSSSEVLRKDPERLLRKEGWRTLLGFRMLKLAIGSSDLTFWISLGVMKGMGNSKRLRIWTLEIRCFGSCSIILGIIFKIFWSIFSKIRFFKNSKSPDLAILRKLTFSFSSTITRSKMNLSTVVPSAKMSHLAKSIFSANELLLMSSGAKYMLSPNPRRPSVDWLKLSPKSANLNRSLPV